MHCSNCGKKVEPENKFCTSCGWKVETEVRENINVESNQTEEAKVEPVQTETTKANQAGDSTDNANTTEDITKKVKVEAEKVSSFIKDQATDVKDEFTNLKNDFKDTKDIKAVSKKLMNYKKILAVAAIVLALGIGMIATLFSSKGPEQTVKAYFKAMSKGNIEKAFDYVDMGAIFGDYGSYKFAGLDDFKSKMITELEREFARSKETRDYKIEVVEAKELSKTKNTCELEVKAKITTKEKGEPAEVEVDTTYIDLVKKDGKWLLEDGGKLGF